MIFFFCFCLVRPCHAPRSCSSIDSVDPTRRLEHSREWIRKGRYGDVRSIFSPNVDEIVNDMLILFSFFFSTLTECGNLEDTPSLRILLVRLCSIERNECEIVYKSLLTQ